MRWLLFSVTELEQPLWRIARHRRIYPEQLRLPAEIDLAKQDFAASPVVLDLHMQQREFVAADRITVADFVLAYTLDWANEALLLAKFPTLVGYLERMYARLRPPSRIRGSR